MFSKLIMASTILILSSTYSFSAERTFYHCKKFEGDIGKVLSVSLGVDDETRDYISFHYKSNGSKGEDEISVKNTLHELAGTQNFAALLQAVNSKSDFEISRCYDDQLAGFTIYPPDGQK